VTPVREKKKYLGDEELAAVYIITGRIARTAIAGIYYSVPDRGSRSIVMSVSASVSVCLSVHDHISGTTRPIFPDFFCAMCVLPVELARSSSGGIMIRYVLPILWMTPYLLISQCCSTSPPS